VKDYFEDASNTCLFIALVHQLIRSSDANDKRFHRILNRYVESLNQKPIMELWKEKTGHKNAYFVKKPNTNIEETVDDKIDEEL
jgi:hypothetical protein